MINLYEIREYRAISSKLIVYRVLCISINLKEAEEQLEIANYIKKIGINKDFITLKKCPEYLIKDYVIALKNRGLKLITIKKVK